MKKGMVLSMMLGLVVLSGCAGKSINIFSGVTDENTSSTTSCETRCCDCDKKPQCELVTLWNIRCLDGTIKHLESLHPPTKEEKDAVCGGERDRCGNLIVPHRSPCGK